MESILSAIVWGGLGACAVLVAYGVVELWRDWRCERWYRRENVKLGDEIKEKFGIDLDEERERRRK